MIMSEEDALAIENAMRLAISMHRKQRDSDGAPYILHLIRVMMRCKTPKAQQAGLLHDLLEDTSATPQDILDAGLSDEVLQAVKRLTHLPGVSYAEYIESLACDPIATEVKLSDLQDNYSIGRVKYREEKHADDASRLQRYILTYRYLQRQINSEQYHRAMQKVDESFSTDN